MPMKLVVACALLLVGPLARAGVSIEHWIAPSGAAVYFVESHVLPMVDIQVDFAAGSAFDPADKVGLANLTQAMLDAGAGNLNEEELAGKLADTGALLFGGSDPDRASIGLRTLTSMAERDAAIDLMRLVLQQPRFPAEVLDREKSRAIASVKEEDTRPDRIAAKRFLAAIYPSHPYGYSSTVETLGRITADDVDEFYRRHYVSGRAVVSIVGDLTRAQAQVIADKLTEGLPKAVGDQSLPHVQLPSRDTIRIAHPATQAHIYLGVPGVQRGAPDYFPLLVGNNILGGGGFESRLLKEVREKRGLAYDVSSDFEPYKELGPFQIVLQTRRDQSDQALKLVLQTLIAFLKNGPTEKELRSTKQNLINGFALRLDSNKKLLDHVAVIGFYRLPLDYLDKFSTRVAKVTAAQIREAFARRVRPERLITVVVAGES